MKVEDREAELYSRSVFWGDTQVSPRVSPAEWKKITFSDYIFIYSQKGKDYLHHASIYYLGNVNGGGKYLKRC